MNDLRMKSNYRSRMFIKTSLMLFHKKVKRKDKLLSDAVYCNRRHGSKSSHIKILIVGNGENLALRCGWFTTGKKIPVLLDWGGVEWVGVGVETDVRCVLDIMLKKLIPNNHLSSL